MPEWIGKDNGEQGKRSYECAKIVFSSQDNDWMVHRIARFKSREFEVRENFW